MAKLTHYAKADLESLKQTAENGAAFVTYDRGILGGGLVLVDKEMLTEISTALKERTAHHKTTFPEIVASLTDEQRMAVASWVFQTLCDHAREGGTFRHLIYDRLGFGPEAYVALCESGGLTISNEFRLPARPGDEQKDLDSQILSSLRENPKNS